MSGKTFAEKILGGRQDHIVIKEPDLILSRDNTTEIAELFHKFGGKAIRYPEKTMIVLDRHITDNNELTKNKYQDIRTFAKEQGISKFHDFGHGICHQLVALHAQPNMLILGSDKHTATAGAFNTFATNISSLENAMVWKNGRMWFRIPQSIKIVLERKLPAHVFAKDLALWIMGNIIETDISNYSIEFHGDGVQTLGISDRMSIANMFSDYGVNNVVFPADEELFRFLDKQTTGTWADIDAEYANEYVFDLSRVFPLVALPNGIQKVKSVSEVRGTMINQAIIGTCANGRIEDLRIAAAVLERRKVHRDVQLFIVPASQMIYVLAEDEGLIQTFIKAGATIMAPSCSFCSGGIYGSNENGLTMISTANMNIFNNKNSNQNDIYLGSPATVAASAIEGFITDTRGIQTKDVYIVRKKDIGLQHISQSENRYKNKVWNFADINNLSGHQILSNQHRQTKQMLPYVLNGLDELFAGKVQQGDMLLLGENVGWDVNMYLLVEVLAQTGIQCIIAKSVSRIFYRTCINSGLLVIICKEAVESYNSGDIITFDLNNSQITVGKNKITFDKYPQEFMDIIQAKGIQNYLKHSNLK